MPLNENNARPICYLDIDGVLNVKPHRGGRPPHLVEIPLPSKRMGIRTRKVYTDPANAERITALAAFFEMRWGSYWHSVSVERYAPAFGFGHDWRWVDFRSHRPPKPPIGTVTYGSDPEIGLIDKKWPGLVHDAQHRPFVFIDDGIQDRHVERALKLPQDVLLIKTRESVGLRDSHVADALDFALHIQGSR